MKNGDKPAFPSVHPVLEGYSEDSGLTKREYFAAKAMQGLIASTVNMSGGVWLGVSHPESNENLATVSCVIADALLEELEK